MRLYRKSDANLLAMVMDERDRIDQARNSAVQECASLRVRAGMAEEQLKAANERIRALEEAQQRNVESQRETVNKLLNATVESNAPVNWPEREQVKVGVAPPRSIVATLKGRVIKAGLAAQKKPEVVQ